MNFWLLAAAAALTLIGATHSAMGERRIFQPWRTAPPAQVRRHHQVILRASWHLPTLLGLGQATAMAWMAASPVAQWPAPALGQAMLAAMALGVAGCGLLVAVATRGRHHGGVAMLAAAALIAKGMQQGAGA